MAEMRLYVLALLALAACSVDRSGLEVPDGSTAHDTGPSDAPSTGDMVVVDTGPVDAPAIDAGDTGPTDSGDDMGVDFGVDGGPPDLGPDAGPCGPCVAPMLCCGTTCVDPRSDLMHCGGCSPCATEASSTPSCISSTCGIVCNTGFADCDTMIADGCESDLSSTLTCGSCGLTCLAGAHQTAMCAAGSGCSAPCDTGFADCDAAASGCETDITSSAAHCGSCGMACSVGRTCASSRCTTGWLPTSAVGAPSARTDHSAVWTGTRMLVWGGDGSTGSLNTGGSYDPATDTWTAITTTGAPTARRGHTAVWTGTEMIIWGGYSTTAGFLNDGGAYNPATGMWRTLSTTMRPSTRSRVPSVWTGTEMVIWAGFGGGGGDHNDGGRYTSSTDAWAPTTNTGRPGARRWNAAVWTGSRMVIWGGETGGGTALADGALYDPVGDGWTTTPSVTPAPTARARAGFVFAGTLTTPVMLVWGGDDGDINGIFGNGVRNTGGRYDPVANSWSAMSASPLAGRSRPGAVWTGSVMMIWGGRGANTGLGMATFLGDGAAYDPVGDTWSAITAIAAPTARSDHTAVWTGTEMIIWGGQDGATPQASGGRYAP